MSVYVVDEQDDPLPTGWVAPFVERILEAEGIQDDYEISVGFIDSARMAELNERYREKPGPTDVLSFALDRFEPGVPPRRAHGAPPITLGDLFICPSVVRSNAEANGTIFDDEMALMVVHGVLHLLGYDHEEEAEAEIMEVRERELLGMKATH